MSLKNILKNHPESISIYIQVVYKNLFTKINQVTAGTIYLSTIFLVSQRPYTLFNGLSALTISPKSKYPHRYGKQF
jgi:hypothetical protein